ncbi:MAG: putative zinc-binding metallopeptidase [Candidatus Polarisedimenticolia bacterium]
MSTPDSGDRPSSGRHWSEVSDEELLKHRICDLGLAIQGTELEARVQALHRELERKGLLKFRPGVYLGDEWFTPEGATSISIPFYLAHPRLKGLERKFMLEVEGGTDPWCMKLLRHESGHCFDHAYGVSRRRLWRRLFGSPSADYDPDAYRPRRYSRRYVIHLDNWYSQAHPHEDFAETFAVWLDPESDWEKRYARWPGALEKLRYVHLLAGECAGKEPSVSGGRQTYAVARLKSTLELFYKKKIKANEEDYPGFFDSDLRAIFDGAAELSRREAGAAEFLRRRRRLIVDTISRWTGEKKYAIDGLVRKLIARCDSTGLRLGRPEAHTNLEVAAWLASLVTRSVFTGRYKRMP